MSFYAKIVIFLVSLHVLHHDGDYKWNNELKLRIYGTASKVRSGIDGG